MSIALLLMISTVWSSGAGSSIDAKSIQKQLAAEYRQIEESFLRNDPSAWIDKLSPDFQLTLFSGEKQNRDWVVNYVRNNAKNFRIQKLSMRIKSLEVHKSDVTAVVEQKSKRTFTDEKGQPRTLEVGALQRETWEHGPNGWRLTAVQEWKLLYLKKR